MFGDIVCSRCHTEIVVDRPTASVKRHDVIDCRFVDQFARIGVEITIAESSQGQHFEHGSFHGLDAVVIPASSTLLFADHPLSEESFSVEHSALSCFDCQDVTMVDLIGSGDCIFMCPPARVPTTPSSPFAFLATVFDSLALVALRGRVGIGVEIRRRFSLTTGDTPTSRPNEEPTHRARSLIPTGDVIGWSGAHAMRTSSPSARV